MWLWYQFLVDACNLFAFELYGYTMSVFDCDKHDLAQTLCIRKK